MSLLKRSIIKYTTGIEKIEVNDDDKVILTIEQYHSMTTALFKYVIAFHALAIAFLFYVYAVFVLL